MHTEMCYQADFLQIKQNSSLTAEKCQIFLYKCGEQTQFKVQSCAHF